MVLDLVKVLICQFMIDQMKATLLVIMLILAIHILIKIIAAAIINHGKDFLDLMERIVSKQNNGKYGSYNCHKFDFY